MDIEAFFHTHVHGYHFRTGTRGGNRYAVGRQPPQEFFRKRQPVESASIMGVHNTESFILPSHFDKPFPPLMPSGVGFVHDFSGIVSPTGINCKQFPFTWMRMSESLDITAQKKGGGVFTPL